MNQKEAVTCSLDTAAPKILSEISWLLTPFFFRQQPHRTNIPGVSRCSCSPVQFCWQSPPWAQWACWAGGCRWGWHRAPAGWQTQTWTCSSLWTPGPPCQWWTWRAPGRCSRGCCRRCGLVSRSSTGHSQRYLFPAPHCHLQSKSPQLWQKQNYIHTMQTQFEIITSLQAMKRSRKVTHVSSTAHWPQGNCPIKYSPELTLSEQVLAPFSPHRKGWLAFYSALQPGDEKLYEITTSNCYSEEIWGFF